MSSLAGVRETESHGPPKERVVGRAGGQGSLRASSLPEASPITVHPQCWRSASLEAGQLLPCSPGDCREGPEACPVGRGGMTAAGPKAGGLSVCVVHAEGEAGCSYFGELVQRHTRGAERAWGWLRPHWGLGGWTGGRDEGPGTTVALGGWKGCSRAPSPQQPLGPLSLPGLNRARGPSCPGRGLSQRRGSARGVHAGGQCRPAAGDG